MKKGGGIKRDGFFKKGDIILLIVLIAAIVSTIVFALSGGADTVDIYVDGELKYELSLFKDTTLDLLDGAMTVVIKNKKVWVEESDCPGQVCVHSAPVGESGGMIVCLPNKVVIKVKGGDVEAVT